MKPSDKLARITIHFFAASGLILVGCTKPGKWMMVPPLTAMAAIGAWKCIKGVRGQG